MLKKLCFILVLSLIGIPLLSDASLSAPLSGESAGGIIRVDTALPGRMPGEPSGLLQPLHAPSGPSDLRSARSPSSQGNPRDERTGDADVRIENTPFYIDPSLMGTFDGQYLDSRGYGWCNFGGKNNSYFRITVNGIPEYPIEFFLKNDFTTQAQFGILIQASHVRVSGIDLTAGSAGDQPVHTITNTYDPLLLSETGAAGIKVGAGYTGVKLVNVNVTTLNFPAIHVDSADVEIIGTNNPDPYLTCYNGGAVNDAWGSAFHAQSQSGYGTGLLQQTNSRSSSITARGSGGTGVSITGPFSGIEVNGDTASLLLTGDHLYVQGTGTESGTGSDRNSGITAWRGTVRVDASDSSILGQEYGIYAREGADIEISCPGCSLDPVGSSVRTTGRDLISILGGGTVIQGGTHGLVLSGVSTPSGSGKVSIDNVLVQGLTGNGINLSQATGYNLSVSDPSVIQGGSGRIGLSGGSSNVVSTGSLTFGTGSETPPYLISVLLDSIAGPDPYNVRIFDEDGQLIHDIHDWNTLPPGVSYDPDTHVLSFEYPAMQFFSGEKYAIPVLSPTVSGITPSSAMNTAIIPLVSVRGLNFQSGAGVNLTRTGYPDIQATATTTASPTLISCSLPVTGAAPGYWDVEVTNPDGGTGTLPGGFLLQSPLQITISTLTPAWGYQGIRCPVIIQGSGFQDRPVVMITQGRTTRYGLNVTRLSSSRIRAVVPAAGFIPGKADITVKNRDGSLVKKVNAFTIRRPGPLPSIATMTPGAGINSANRKVLITGTNFRPGVTIHLIHGGVVRKGTVLWRTLNKIYCLLPIQGAPAGSWDLKVTNPDGTTARKYRAFTIRSGMAGQAWDPGRNGGIVLKSPAPDPSSGPPAASGGFGSGIIPVRVPISGTPVLK